MIANFETLAEHVKIHREHKKLTQEALEKALSGVTRSNIAHLEQVRRFPSKDVLEKICRHLDIPDPYWKPFMSDKTRLRADFEVSLRELVGEPISTLNLDPTVIENVENEIQYLFTETLTSEQTFDKYNSILVFYGIRPVSKGFFDRYLGKEALNSMKGFDEAIERYLTDALRLFSSIPEAYERLNNRSLRETIMPLENLDTEPYFKRTTWDRIKAIPDDKLALLGYIAADKIDKENAEKEELVSFLKEVIKQKKELGVINVEKFTAKRRNKIDSLLRKYGSKIEHGVFSPLFQPDVDLLEREAARLAPKNEDEIQEIQKFQARAYENLANYLTADFMDVYVATSMRSEADFISVNHFVNSLFEETDIKHFKLRYFNPTQSWVEDRVAKGLVEALMLKRATVCVYMAQKEDTFGKDSEASVSLGQGKPVLVYVPRLYYEDGSIDSEKFGRLSEKELIELIIRTDDKLKTDIDEQDDQEALHAVLLRALFKRLSSQQFTEIVKNHWADFDLYGELDDRLTKLEDEEIKKQTKAWMDNIIKGRSSMILETDVRTTLTQTLIARTMRFERRAKIFREIHPLALQVILSTGVLNGILVVRSIDSCSKLLKALIENKLNLKLKVDKDNYRLIEKDTQSTIRVISRHKLIANAFLTFYKQLK